jgi:hypothetical protein
MPENISVRMTIGRQVDPQGNVHLEGKGVAPTVKVPVTVDTLQNEANGVDVVLAAAVKALNTPASAGVKPSGQPTISNAKDSNAALTAGTAFLEDKAREKHTAAEMAQPGKVPYTVSLAVSEPLIWGYTWCAKDKATVDQNIKAIKLKFDLDGEDVTGKMATADGTLGGQACHLVFAQLTDWPAGEHHLTITANFSAKINDGAADYPAGNYILDFTVYVNK